MKHILILLIVLGISGCGISRKEWVTINCSQSGAQELGKSDAKNNRRTGEIALKQKCPQDQHETALKAYQEGVASVPNSGLSSDKQYGQDLLQDVVNVLNDESKPAEPKKKKQSESSSN